MTTLRSFDGYDPPDPTKTDARRILDAAIEDEIRMCGRAVCSPSLACFIEFRISQYLTNYGGVI